jgi:hypothetical protein
MGKYCQAFILSRATKEYGRTSQVDTQACSKEGCLSRESIVFRYLRMPSADTEVCMSERFISEPLAPVVATCDPSRMALGEPGLPREFLWRDRTLRVEAVLSSWRQSGPCRHGSGEKYVRRHWFEVVTSSREVAKLYFDRQQRSGRNAPRWWLFSLRDHESGSSPE